MVLIATISMVLGGYGVISGLFEIMRNPATMDAGFLVALLFWAVPGLGGILSLMRMAKTKRMKATDKSTKPPSS